jgi:hypothetical protein
LIKASLLQGPVVVGVLVDDEVDVVVDEATITA